MAQAAPRTILCFCLLLGLSACFGQSSTSPRPTTNEATCAALKAAITEAAREESSCTEHSDCGHRKVAICDVEGLGCYEHITHTGRSPEELNHAIEAYKNANCPVSKCKCKRGPAVFECNKGRCTAAPCTQRVKPKCKPERTCPEFINQPVPCP